MLIKLKANTNKTDKERKDWKWLTEEERGKVEMSLSI